jgi:hypothetical protein
MFTALVEHMNDALSHRRPATYDNPMEVPAWLAS